MTDNLKFFNPETGQEMYRVPVDATIPAGMPHGWIGADGSRMYGVLPGDAEVKPYSRPHFTAEPIRPPLPAEVGSLIRATDVNGDTCEVMALSVGGEWCGVDRVGFLRRWSPDVITEWSPVRVVPAEGGGAS